MKKIITLAWLALSSVCLFAQNINYQIYTKRYYTGFGNTDVWSSDDPRWKVLFYDNTDGYVSGIGVLRSIDNGLDGPSWDDPTDYLCRSGSNTSATGVKVRLEAWEEDDNGSGNTYDNGDDNYCSLLSSVISFRNDPICTWNNYSFSCNSGWAVDYKIYWEWANAPGITTQPNPTDRNLCVGASTIISVVGDASARFYQWQVSTNTDCVGATNWINVSSGTGGSTASYTPPQTPGSRLYRCLVTSNCPADFTSKTTTSNCVRINYFPYAPAIQSSVCGLNTTLNSTQVFSVLTPPSVGAIGGVASYTWSVSPAGPVITSPNATSTNISFPTSGTFTVSLTVDDSGGPCASAVSTCVVTVNSPDCDFIYCDPSVSNVTGGSANTPVNLMGAIALVSGTRKHIRVLGGTYNNLPILTIPTTATASGITIEGGYINTSGTWTKSSSATTTLNFIGTETIDNDVAHVIGIKAINTSGLTLQDLSITTAAASGQTTSGNGKSNYAVYFNNSSNWLITRCAISSGNATAGTNGVAGANGALGGGGAIGGTGDCGLGNSTGGAGGNGGNGGAGGSGGAGGDGTSGNTGGYGGGGGSDNGTTTSTTSISQSAGNWNGRKGNTGNGSNPGIGGDGGAWSSDNSCGNNAGQGSSGSSATAPGSAGTAGSTSSIAYTGGFVIPSYGNVGTGGTGGNGGGGGGGGGGDDAGTDVAGDGGNGGGGGGGGGEGGTGARGGGSSFAVFAYANLSGSSISNSTLNTGTAGAATIGGNGGAGGSAGAGSTTQNCSCGDGNRGGIGGNGSAGGNGGKGGDAVAGLRYGIANATLSGLTSTNAPSAPIVVNSAASGGSIPNPTNAIIVNYNNTKGCTNSYISLQKGASSGNWSNYGLDGDEVFDITSSLQSTGITSNPVSTYYTTTGWKDISTSTDTRERLLNVSTARTPPVINGVSSPICQDGQLSLTCTPNSPSSTIGYEWTVQLTPVTGLTSPTAVFTSSVATPVFTLPNATAADITYQIKLRVQDQCCGWSIPVFAFVTVRPAFTAGSISGTQSICYSGDPTNLTSASLPANNVGTISYQWYYQDNCTGPWNAIAGATSPSYDPPLGLVSTRCYYREAQNCSKTLQSNTLTVTVLENFNPGTLVTANDTLCGGGDPDNITFSINPLGGSGTYLYQWYYKDGLSPCPSGNSTSGWTLIPGATSSSYDPPSGLTVSRTYAVTVDPTGLPDCGSAQWASSCRQITISQPAAFTASIQTNLPLCYKSNAWIKVSTAQNGISYQLNDGVSNVGLVQTGTGVDLDFYTANLTAGSSTYNIVATGADGCTRTANLSTITVDASPSALPGVYESRTCYVRANNDFVEFTSSNGVIAAVNPGTQNLGYVAITEYVSGSPITVQACGTYQTWFQTSVLGRHWTISSTVPPNGPVQVRLYYNNSDFTALVTASTTNSNLNDDVLTESDIQLNKYSGANENGNFSDNCGNGTTSIINHSAAGNMSVANVGYTVPPGKYFNFGISSFSELWLGGTNNVSPLPVELVNLKSHCDKNGQIELEWETLSEIDNQGFIVQRSADGITWENTDTIAGAGNSNASIKYNSTDERPLTHVNYYRIIQVDYNGNSKTYEPISEICEIDSQNELWVYPNPADLQFTVHLFLADNLNKPAYLEIYDITGKLISSKNIQQDITVADYIYHALEFEPGTYIIRLKSNEVILKPVKIIIK